MGVARAGTPLGSKLSTSLGVIASVVLAVLVNIYCARHYKRWDVTSGGVFTLSQATLETLRTLEEPLEIEVLLGAGDPLQSSVRHLLDAYTAQTSRVSVHLIDPDRSPAAFLALQERFGLATAKTDDGRVLADAAVVVVRGDRPHFLTRTDLVETRAEDGERARPRLEQAVTGAIRRLMSSERPKVCFTVGHGEPTTEGDGPLGLTPFRERLLRNNFAPVELALDHEEQRGALSECRVLVIAGPTSAIPKADVETIQRYFEGGGSVLVAAGPEPDEGDAHYVDLGLGPLLDAAGLQLDQDFLFERDPRARTNAGFGETFLPQPKRHAITEGMLRRKQSGVLPTLSVARSIRANGHGRAVPVPLLVTSDSAFGMVDFFRWARAPGLPSPAAEDLKGPLTLAWAVELPKVRSSDPHGPRLCAVGSASLLFGANWQKAELQGTAWFAESALTWLAAKPTLLDIPNRPAFVAGLNLSEEDLAGVFRDVVLYLPGTAALLGVAVHLRRRRGSHARGARAVPRPPSRPSP